eukprot:GDKI01023223.1.p2 GENE.GDKI01023223.1~~GDKI01023223.1.p2  ORF type:complete len:210 (-),score=66.00 GDKI01023223.1:105-734(-)
MRFTACLLVASAAFLCGPADAAIPMPPVAPGLKTAIRNELLGKSDFQLNIHPPEEDTQDVLDALDSLLKIEESERRADEDDYVSEKKRLLNIQKNRIRDIVHAAFEPLHAALPNPIRTEVTRILSRYTFPSAAQSGMGEAGPASTSVTSATAPRFAQKDATEADDKSEGELKFGGTAMAENVQQAQAEKEEKMKAPQNGPVDIANLRKP